MVISRLYGTRPHRIALPWQPLGRQPSPYFSVYCGWFSRAPGSLSLSLFDIRSGAAFLGARAWQGTGREQMILVRCRWCTTLSTVYWVPRPFGYRRRPDMESRRFLLPRRDASKRGNRLGFWGTGRFPNSTTHRKNACFDPAAFRDRMFDYLSLLKPLACPVSRANA